MSTVAEIESAIDQLPTEQMLAVARRLDDRRAMLSASEAMFQQLDQTEGEDATDRRADERFKMLDAMEAEDGKTGSR